MLASSSIPRNYADWNRLHGAPNGHDIPCWKRAISGTRTLQRLRGPFSIQGNNSIRRFEYPWAFDVARLEPGQRVLEIGGGLAGFQFVLDQFGCRVVNVDPGMVEQSWPCDKASMAKLNQRLAAMSNCGIPPWKRQIYLTTVLTGLFQSALLNTLQKKT